MIKDLFNGYTECGPEYNIFGEICTKITNDNARQVTKEDMIVENMFKTHSYTLHTDFGLTPSTSNIMIVDKAIT